MPTAVIRYATAVASAGAALLLLACASWPGTDLARFAGYIVLAAIVSTCKVKLPGLTSTVSPGFAVLLASVVELSWAETLLLAVVSGLVQSLWRPKRRPMPIQIAFNVATLVISATVAFQLAHQLVADNVAHAAAARVAVATVAIFAANTLLVAVLMGLLEGGNGSFASWRRIHLWTFPHYLVGAVVTTGVFVVSAAAGLPAVWLVLPALYLQFAYQREMADRST
jgi:hypothetical protein